MGRDKEPKPAAPKVPEPAPVIGLDGKPVRPPKGHKQRGAGTIITAKAPIVTNEGIVLKIHERLPSTLLSEYCQREKRPGPKYLPAPPGHRFRVFLEDTKNSKNDLNFLPVQKFESDKMARDYAALLALFHFQKTLPLERKLPEPFASTWLQLLATDKAEAAEKAGPGRKGAITSSKVVSKVAGGGEVIEAAVVLKMSGNDEVAMDTASTVVSASVTVDNNADDHDGADTSAVVGYQKYVKQAAPAPEVKLDRATADWLCDDCGNQNFARLLSGAPRLKCFKCQAKKSATCELVISAAAAAAAEASGSTPISTASSAATVSLTSAKQSGGGLDRVTSKDKLALSALTASTGASVSVKSMKAPPAAVLDLKSATVHASQGEADRKKEEEKHAKKRKNAFFDALRRANRPTAVLLCPNMRRMLERALGLVSESIGIINSELAEMGIIEGGDGTGASRQDEDTGAVQKLTDNMEREGQAIVSVVESGVSLPQQLAAVRGVAGTLQKQGFRGQAIALAVRAIAGAPDDTLLDELSNSKQQRASSSSSSSSSLQAAFVSSLQASLFEYLCLHVDDAALPSLFDARSNEGLRTLDVVSTSGGGKNAGGGKSTGAGDKITTAGDKSIGGGKDAGSIGSASNRVSSSTVDEPVPTSAPSPSSPPPSGSPIPLDAEEAADVGRLCGYGWSEGDCAQAVVLARRLMAAFPTSALARLVALTSSSSGGEALSMDGGAAWTARRWSALALLWCGTRWTLSEQAGTGSGLKDDVDEQLVGRQHHRESILSYLRAVFFPPMMMTEGVDGPLDDVMAEGESLSSIFPETFTHTPLVHHNQHKGQGFASGLPQVHVFSLRLTRVADMRSHPHPALSRVCSAADTALEVFVLMGAQGPHYPHTAPIALLSSAALRTLASAPGSGSGGKGDDEDGLGLAVEGESWSGRRGAVLGVQIALWGEADRHVGDPQVFQLASAAEEKLGEWLHKGLSGSDRGSRVPSGAVAGSVRALLADMLSQGRLLQAGPGGSGSGSGTENKEARSELEAWLESQSQSLAETGLGGGGDGAVDVCDVAVAVREGSDDEDQGWDKDDNDDDDNNTISTAALTVASSSSGRSGGGNGRNSNRSGGGTSAGSAVKRERGNHPFWTRLPAAAAHNPSAAPGSSSSSSSGDLAGDNVGVGRSAAYQKMLTGRRGLPAWASRAEFLSTMEAHRAVVVTGETGCGKTTQIPQFLHEAAGGRAKIVVCQPRRLAAVGVATRVAEELASAIGEEVGYMVKGDSKASARTRIVFVTYGVLLRRLKDDPSLAAIDYVILDEVHERGVDSDFTLALLMSALTATSASGGGGSASKRLKLILMSATMATDKFATYLGQGLHQSAPAPVLSIPGYTYPVTEYWKGDYEETLRTEDELYYPRGGYGGGGYNNGYDDEEEDGGRGGGGGGRGSGGNGGDPHRDRGSLKGGGRIGGKQRKGDVDYDLMVRLLVRLALGPACDDEKNKGSGSAMFSRAEGAVLVFMPGVPEITRLIQLLDQTWTDVTAGTSSSSSSSSSPPRLRVMPLHGNLSPQEQRGVFEVARRGVHELKIIVATNVAEASVTISDVTVVVDCCRVKEMDFDVERQMSALVMKKASQDSLRQRRGRAGRVSAGRCFRLLTAGTCEKLPLHSVPEMLRAPLQSLVLQVKAMDLSEDCERLLRRCPDPPSRSAVQAAIRHLVAIQALESSGSGGADAQGGGGSGNGSASNAITPLGRHLADLPCDPAIGRLLVYGALLGCVFPAAAVAAALCVRSPFITPGPSDPDGRARSDAARKAFVLAAGAKSDHAGVAEALRQYSLLRGAGDQRRFCREHSLSFERMGEIQQQQRDLLDGLAALGFLRSASEGMQLNQPPTTAKNTASSALNSALTGPNRNAGQPRVLMAALCAGMYPNVARILRPPTRYVETMGGLIEKDVQGKELKFFIPANLLAPDTTAAATLTSGDSSGKAGGSGEVRSGSSLPGAPSGLGSGLGLGSPPAECAVVDDASTAGLERVFIHPSSVNFANTAFRPSNYLLYGERQLSVTLGGGGSAGAGSSSSAAATGSTDRAYIRDTSEVSAFPLLFFGGKLEAQYLEGTVTVDGWIRFSAPGKIVALIQSLRRGLNSLLLDKIERPHECDVEASAVLQAVCTLLASDGLE